MYKNIDKNLYNDELTTIFSPYWRCIAQQHSTVHTNYWVALVGIKYCYLCNLWSVQNWIYVLSIPSGLLQIHITAYNQILQYFGVVFLNLKSSNHRSMKREQDPLTGSYLSSYTRQSPFFLAAKDIKNKTVRTS